MEKLLITIGLWAGVYLAYYLATMTPPYYANCPRWLVLTIRWSAASYGAMIALRQLFIYRNIETAAFVSAVFGLISMLVVATALFFASNIGRYRHGPTK
jgi:hypothetical protein